ncbi:hypothetical protein [Streptomyces sp. AM6-12]|uniref:hypothetical protein n=1 Tax=Streptomyces sp. AM6-12 TaxID=3345149 RepID=UPI0037A40F11
MRPCGNPAVRGSDNWSGTAGQESAVRRTLETRLTDHTPSRAAGPAAARARKTPPPPVLYGFLLLLAAVFAAAYAVGASAGPVAPGLPGTRPAPTGTGGHGGGTDTGDMGGMEMSHGSGG